MKMIELLTPQEKNEIWNKMKLTQIEIGEMVEIATERLNIKNKFYNVLLRAGNSFMELGESDQAVLELESKSSSFEGMTIHFTKHAFLEGCSFGLQVYNSVLDDEIQKFFKESEIHPPDIDFRK